MRDSQQKYLCNRRCDFSFTLAAALSIGLLAVTASIESCKSRTASTQPVTGSHSPQLRSILDIHVPPPPGVEIKVLAPREGEALTKARMSLDAIITSLPSPEYLSATTQPATQPADFQSEPPLAAQLKYVEARQAWLDRRAFDAIRELQAADVLAPNRPEILSLLGQIYSYSGNKVRGGYYLEQAVKLDPYDAESLYLLGRYALEQGKEGEAIVDFAAAMKVAGKVDDVDQALWPMIAFSLGNALDSAGYDLAASEQYRFSLDHSNLVGRSSRLGREVSFLTRQRASTFQSLGDTLNRLGKIREAMEAYTDSLAAVEDKPEPEIIARLTYTQLRAGWRDAAQDTVISYVNRSNAAPASIELVRYIVTNGVDGNPLASKLESIYKKDGQPQQLALAIASILGTPNGLAFLESHLDAKPGDRAVFEQLVKETLALPASDPLGPTRAVRLTSRAITSQPNLAREYSDSMIQAAPRSLDLPGVIDATNVDTKYQSARSYLKARSLAAAGQADEAATAYEVASRGDGAIPAAKVEFARLSALRGDITRANEILDSMGDRQDSDTVALRVALLADAGKHAEALALVESLITKSPTNVALVIQKAALQQATNDISGAERTLLDALDSNSQSESIYEALFALYNSPQAPPDSTKQFQRLMLRLTRALPNSRLARLMNAEILAARGDTSQAEEMFRSLLKDNPRDIEALASLADLLVRGQRRDEANKLIDEAVLTNPKDRGILMVARGHYLQRVPDRQKAYELEEKLIALNPASPSRAAAMANLYARTNRTQEAIALLNEAMRTYPEKVNDLKVELSTVYDRMGDHLKSEALLQEVLRDQPDHDRAMNGLGYSWANRGEHLDEARIMIEKAVEKDRDNAAYLDSLGWVYYKLGRFADAVQQLERARNAPGGDYPVILEHLADAYYRIGRSKEAITTWARAQIKLAQEDAENDRELIGLGERVRLKIEAAQSGKPVPISDVPGVPSEVRPAEQNPTTSPASAP